MTVSVNTLLKFYMVLRSSIVRQQHKRSELYCNVGREAVTYRSAFVIYFSRAVDNLLAEQLLSANRNALYTSKTTQDQVIELCGNIIRNAILELVSKANQFSMIADEATDSANDEQHSKSVRYINPLSQDIKERFLVFRECVAGVTGG